MNRQVVAQIGRWHVPFSVVVRVFVCTVAAYSIMRVKGGTPARLAHCTQMHCVASWPASCHDNRVRAFRWVLSTFRIRVRMMKAAALSFASRHFSQLEVVNINARGVQAFESR